MVEPSRSAVMMPSCATLTISGSFELQTAFVWPSSGETVKESFAEEPSCRVCYFWAMEAV